MYRNRGQHGHGRFSAQIKQPPPSSQSWGDGGGNDPGVMVFTPESGATQQGSSQWDWNSAWDATPAPSAPSQPPAADGYGGPHRPAGQSHHQQLAGMPPPAGQPVSLPPMSTAHGPTEGHHAMQATDVKANQNMTQASHGPQSMPLSEGHGHQNMPPSSGHGHNNMPPSSGHQLQNLPPSGHGHQNIPPSSGHGHQNMPPSSGHGHQNMPPSSGHGHKNMPPSSGHQLQNLPPSSGHQPQNMPPSSGHGPQTMPPPSGNGPQSIPHPSGLDMPPPQMHRPPGSMSVGPTPSHRALPPGVGEADGGWGHMPPGGAAPPVSLPPPSSVNNTSPPSHPYAPPAGAPYQPAGYPPPMSYPPSSALNSDSAHPGQYPPPTVTATAPTPEQYPAQPTSQQNHYSDLYPPGAEFAAVSTPITPAEMVYPPVPQESYTPAEQPGAFTAEERGSYEAAGYANGDAGASDWGWNESAGGWGGDGTDGDIPPGTDTRSQPAYPPETPSQPAVGVAGSQTTIGGAAPGADVWGWGHEPAAKPAGGGEPEDEGTVGVYFGRGEDQALDAVTAGMEQMHVNGPGLQQYTRAGYDGLPMDSPPSHAPPLGHRMTPTGGREGDEPLGQVAEPPPGLPARDSRVPPQPTPPGMGRPDSLTRPGSLEGRQGRGSVVSDVSDGPERPQSTVSSGSHRSASGPQTQQQQPPPPPSEQRNSPLGTVGAAVPPTMPPSRGVVPPQERGHARGEREEPENREVPPPEMEMQQPSEHGSVPVAGGMDWTHPQGDGSHAPPPPASQPAAPPPTPRIVPGTAPGPAAGAAPRSAFATVKPTSAPPPAATAPGAPRPPPDGPGADASGRRSPPDGPRPPRSETIGSEDGAAAANSGGGGVGNPPPAAPQRSTRRGDGEDDSIRDREDRDDSRERERVAEERRERDRDDRRDRDRYDRRGYDDRDRRDRDRRDRDVDRDDRYYDRDRRRRYDSFDSRRGDEFRDYDRDRHGRRRDDRHARDRDEYEDRRRRDRRRDPRDDYYDPDRSRPSSRAGSERDFDGRPPSRSHSYYSHRDNSYHGGYGYRERGASRQPDPALYAHGYAGGAGGGGQRPLYDDRTLYSYFVHLERLRASNPQLFTQQMAAYRTNNPAFYRDLCQRHYRSLLQPAAGAAAATAGGGYPGYPGSEERTSVHSGRSSVNEEENKNTFADQFHQHRPTSALGYEPSAILGNDSYAASEVSYRLRRFEEEAVMTSASEAKPDRMTPAKFAYPHTVVRFSATGQLVRVLPHSPADGSAALVEIHDTSALLANTPETQDLKRFPGPLVKNDTHKSSVQQFCQQKVREAEQQPGLIDKDSCVLVWQLLLLLIRQNGMVVGSDMAELLLRDRAGSTSPSSEAGDDPEPASETSESVDRALVSRSSDRPAQHRHVRRFSELLMYGHRKEALELAMKRGIWGHALFLASKMDQRTYGQVMARFANGLLFNDPLQTLYQLMSGRQPSCTTSCADERWGDWRPHLAMILSNTSHRPELNRRAIVTLGDTLASRGLLHASHFCYLMAQCEFGPFWRKSSKLVLIGSPHQLSWSLFATNEAIQRTEVFEYAQSLGTTDYVLTHLQAMKFLYATRLAEVGLVSECLHYCEVIAQLIAKYPTSFNYALVSRVYNLGSQLKFLDSHYQSGEGELADMGDPEWLVALQNVIAEMQAGRLAAYPAPEGGAPAEGEAAEAVATPGDSQQQVQQGYDPQQQVQQGYDPQQQVQQGYDPQQQVQQGYDPAPQQTQYGQDQPEPTYAQPENSSQAPLQPEQTQMYDPSQPQYGGYDTGTQQTFVPPPATDQPDGQTGDYWGGWGYTSTPAPAPAPAAEEGAEPSAGASVEATLPPSTNDAGNFNYWDGPQRKMSEASSLPSEGESEPAKSQTTPTSSAGGQSAPAAGANNKPAAGSGWFGGIFSKFAKPKNQMILPEDKDKSIVYDPDKKRWVDKDADPNDQSAQAAAAPPSDSQLSGGGGGLPPPPSAGGPGNKFKIPKGRGLRSNYVDVFGGSSAGASPGAAPPVAMPAMVSPLVPTPGSISGGDPQPDQQQLQPAGGEAPGGSSGAAGAPPMFNPGQVTTTPASVTPAAGRGRLGRYGRR